MKLYLVPGIMYRYGYSYIVEHIVGPRENDIDALFARLFFYTVFRAFMEMFLVHVNISYAFSCTKNDVRKVDFGCEHCSTLFHHNQGYCFGLACNKYRIHTEH